jgi:hypothetical protein
MVRLSADGKKPLALRFALRAAKLVLMSSKEIDSIGGGGGSFFRSYKKMNWSLQNHVYDVRTSANSGSIVAIFSAS